MSQANATSSEGCRDVEWRWWRRRWVDEGLGRKASASEGGPGGSVRRLWAKDVQASRKRSRWDSCRGITSPSE
jgi:hypothetical protein